MAMQVSDRGESTKTLSAARASAMLGEWRLTPATLMAKLDSSWIPAPWLQYLSLKIAQTIARGNCGLLISAPPRHGKSMLSTIATPLWCLENFPGKNVIVATYGEELSTDFTRTVRDLIQQHQAELRVRLRQDARRVTNILTTEGGGLKAVGLRGAITGRGADVLIIDDYIKEPKEAMSPTYLEDLWDWWRTVARTRLEPGAVVIILATRWVAHDLHGRIIKHQKETGRSFFEHVALSALAFPGEVDVLGRQPGQVLFPERYNVDAIMDIKAELGTRWFNAMFQQRPQDDESRVLDPNWFQRITAAEFDRRYDHMLKEQKGVLTWNRSWDLASTKEAGDYTSGALTLYNKETEELYIRNIARGQWSSAKVEKEFEDLSKLDAQTYFRHGVSYKVGLEQEPGSSGTYTTNHLKKILKDAEIDARLTEQRATTSKLLNAQPLLAAAENKKVFVVCDYDDNGIVVGWARDLYAELEMFPEAEHDDQVDSLSIGYKQQTGKSFLKPTFGRKRADQQRGAAAPEAREIAAKRPIRVTFGRRLRKVA
jgi:predicted phage terminase large subunit-like protein